MAGGKNVNAAAVLLLVMSKMLVGFVTVRAAANNINADMIKYDQCLRSLCIPACMEAGGVTDVYCRLQCANPCRGYSARKGANRIISLNSGGRVGVGVGGRTEVSSYSNCVNVQCMPECMKNAGSTVSSCKQECTALCNDSQDP
uniref:Thionin-like protein 2 n=1 Tax=Nelumbo nucifera TaxID=4432 RepID=A0A822ZC47_NELNU|nr:TPA_asm: hypothetical protein HUJ06_000310 [Nelumbo nucifera]